MGDDLALLDAWAGGDMEAAETLLDRHIEPISRFFRGKVRDDIDDLVQETFTRLLALRRTLPEGSSFRAYLFTVARNLLFEHLRRAARRPVLDGAVVSVADLDPSPSAMVRDSEERRLLLDALRRIPIDSQVVLELFYWEELSVAELAIALEIPVGTVKSRLHRARGQLRTRLAEVVQDPARLETTLSSFAGWARGLERAT